MASPKIGATSLDAARFITNEPAGPAQPPVGGSARQPARLQHEALVGRSMSQPLDVGRPRRNAQLELTASPHTFSSASLSVQVSPNSSPSVSALSTADRSDRFTADWVALAANQSIAQRAAAQQGLQPTEGTANAPQPPAARSWRATVTAMVGQLANGVSAAAGTTANRAGATLQNVAGTATHAVGFVAGELKAQVQALGVMIPSGRTMGAVAGHVIHQSTAVGVSTFVREMMAEALVLSMRHMPPDQVLALQLTTGVVSTGVQLYRRTLENRNPEAAARGFHAMSQEQWNGLSDSVKANLSRQQVAHSRLVTNLQMVSSTASLMVATMAAKSGDPSLAETPARILATDLKAAVYCALRDMTQASFNMVGTAAPTTGVSGAHMSSSASFFALMAAATDYGFSYLPSKVPGADLASQVLRGTQPAGTEMTRGEAWLARAGVAAVKSAINTTLHASDWMYMTQEEANQAGTVQRWDPKLKLIHPESHDYSRIKDHVPARIAWLSGGNSIGNVISFAMRNSPEPLSTAVGNFADAAYQGVIYKTIVGTWQAEGEVRANPTPPSSVSGSGSHDLEAGGSPPAAQSLSALFAASRSRSGSSRLA